MTEKQRKTLAVIGFIVFVLFIAAGCWFVGRPLIEFVSEPELFRAWVDSHGVMGRLAFLGMMVLQVVVALIPGEPMEIGAGYAFGAIEGTALCIIGTTVGSALVFLFVRKFGRRAVGVFFPAEQIDSFRLFRNPKRLRRILFLCFLIPGTPKDLLTYMAGLANLRLSEFLLLSMVARIPSIVTSTVGGNALGKENYLFAAVVFVVTMAVSAVGVLVYNKIKKG